MICEPIESQLLGYQLWAILTAYPAGIGLAWLIDRLKRWLKARAA